MQSALYSVSVEHNDRAEQSLAGSLLVVDWVLTLHDDQIRSVFLIASSLNVLQTRLEDESVRRDAISYYQLI